MAEMMQNGNGRNGRKGRGIRTPGRVDMTPMVDLAGLLLTFFMLTTAFTQFRYLDMADTAKPGASEAQWDAKTLTVLVDESKEKIYCYFGEFGPSVHLDCVSPGKDGFRKLLFDNNGHVIAKVNALSKNTALTPKDRQARIESALADENGLKVIVKTGNKARYETVVKVLDDMQLGRVARYTLSDITPEEANMIAAQTRTASLK